MNNAYDQRGYYSPRKENMCYDNRAMVTLTPAQSERTISPTVRVIIPDVEKTATQSDQKPTKVVFRRRLHVHHVINLLITAIVTALIIVTEYGILPGAKLGYTCEDPTISHKFKGEMVTPFMLLFGSMLLPLIVLFAVDTLSNNFVKKINFSRVWFYYKECTIGCVLVLLITEVIKVLVGEHRPHFMDVCEPDTGKSCVPGTFIETFTCTNTKYSAYFIRDTSRSFPSGHSSVSVFVSLFSAYIIHARLPVAKVGRLLKPFLISACITWCLVCSMSRITDRRHHWWDVAGGMLLGALGAIYTIKIVDNKMKFRRDPTPISTSTTTLLDVKNKDATSINI